MSLPLLSDSDMGAYINCHIGADFILANLLFSHCHCIIFSLSSHHTLYIIHVAIRIFHVQQGKERGWQSSRDCSWLSQWLSAELGSSPNLTASQLSPLGNCKGDRRTFKIM